MHAGIVAARGPRTVDVRQGGPSRTEARHLRQIKPPGTGAPNNGRAIRHDPAMPETFDPIAVRQRLARRESELQVLLREHTLEAALEGSDDRTADFKDMAGAETQARVDGAQAAQAMAELRLLHAARQRVNDGTYGTCVDCGEEIDERRLQSLPGTPYCASCQSLRERRPARH